MAVRGIETAIVFSGAAGVLAVVGWAVLSAPPRPATVPLPSAPRPLALAVAAIDPGPQGFIAIVANEAEWNPATPPIAWPHFTKLPDEPPLPTRTARQKIDEAKAIVARWDAFKSGKSKSRPTSDESGNAVKQILSLDPKSPEFPEAWVAFVRLRQVDRDISKEAALERGRAMLAKEAANAKTEGVRIGMTADQVRKSSWGRPKSINETITSAGRREQWVYGNSYLYLENGVLTSIQTSRR
jgi:hypothetical protein